MHVHIYVCIYIYIHMITCTYIDLGHTRLGHGELASENSSDDDYIYIHI
jgi:hypothetical protein